MLVPLEATIAHFLSKLFPQMEIGECAAFRVTRDADFEVSDEADDLLEAVELDSAETLRRRRAARGLARSMSDRMLLRLVEGLGASADHVYQIQGLLDLADLNQIAGLERPDLKDDAWVPRTPTAFAGARRTADIFDAVKRQDILVHHPYDSFATTFEAFVRGAADRPPHGDEDDRLDERRLSARAGARRMRGGRKAERLPRRAPEARFDEHKNIEWSRGARARRRARRLRVPEPEDPREDDADRPAGGGRPPAVRPPRHGNYHSLTARIYEDLGLFTADEDIAADVADLFNHITGFGRPQRFGSSSSRRSGSRGLIDEIQLVTAAAKAGKTARIRFKVNALTDPKIIQALYAASQAGAEIDIFARSISSLWPGLDGISETIRVRSVLGQFLEHSRVFAFQAGKRSVYYLGSADAHAAEPRQPPGVLAPVENTLIQQRLSGVFDVLLQDNFQAGISVRTEPGGARDRRRTRRGAGRTRC